MPDRPLLCYITARASFPGDEAERRRKLLAKISEAAACGVDFVQLREKDPSSRRLEELALEARKALDDLNVTGGKRQTTLLINSRCDVALATGADGVHLRSVDISVSEARKVRELAFSRKRNPESGSWIVAVSCHSEEEVRVAAGEGADFVVFGPIFEKTGAPGTTPAGLHALHMASRHNIPVLALGGVTLQSAQSCMEAGAAGIAGIRLFQENDISAVVQRLRPSGGSRPLC
jgi:thiamine-phosphate pyrophosphorylase